MDESHPSGAQPSGVAQWWTTEAATFAIMVVATAAVWGHTVDEIRIGELSAIPAGVLNLGLLASWHRLASRARGWLALLFGVFWAVTVIPYHVMPLMQGLATWQNISGLLRVIGGVTMTAAGIQTLRNKRRTDSNSS